MFETIHAAAEAIRQKTVTPLDILDQCLAQIDRWESKVRAWVFIDRERARADAVRLTDELKRGDYRGPLHGIPIGVKDIFDVFDWPTAAGSKLWANSIARKDAAIIANLRSAGAVFLGKTVTTQYASFDPPVTRNPWNLERTPGGSSSGSAAAVSTLMCLGALGSQTGGSLTRPAAYCGIATCKPSYGLLPVEGVVPLAPSMDHPGPMGRCVKDVALLLQYMGVGSVDAAIRRERTNYAKASEPPSVPPGLLRVRGLFEERAEPAVRRAMDKVCKMLTERGARMVEHSLPPAFAEVIARHRIVMAVEAAAFHESRLRAHPEDYAPRIRSLIEEGLACRAPEYASTKAHQAELQRAMVMSALGSDVIITPATLGPAPGADTTGDPAFNSPWSYTGLPTVSFPMGDFEDSLPLGVQFVGRAYQEPGLFSAAAWCEQALGVAPLNPPAK